ncbi:MAG: hypothetical protein JWM46_503 [Candidatus Kaiserbacteria bacterium]|nr:hypothetical protein [Candidatus Kaiserbacteria bacterium]
MRFFRLFLYVLVLTGLSAGTAHAATPGFFPLADSSQSPMLNSAYQSGNLGQYVNTLFKISLSVGAILAVMRIAYAGYLYMGSDMWGNKQKAKEVLGDVTLGILLLLSIYLILGQINPQLLNLNILNSVQQSQAAPASSAAQAPVSTYGGIPAATQNVNGVPVDQMGNPIN